MAIENVSVVLAHGAWADGSSWAQVISALDAHGAKVAAAPLPLTSLADDVAALNRSIERMPGPVVLAIPEDVLDEVVSANDLPPFERARSYPAPPGRGSGRRQPAP